MALTRTTDWAKDVRGALVTVERSVGQLRHSEQLVADFILARPDLVVSASITDVAKRVGTSEATVLRCCRSLGYGGFPDFKLALARDLTRSEKEGSTSNEFTISDPAEKLAFLTFENAALALSETLELQQASEFQRTVTAIANASRVIVTAASSRSFLAQEIQRRLCGLGFQVVRASPDSVEVSVGVMNVDDAVIAFASALDDHWLSSFLEYCGSRKVCRILCTPVMSAALEDVADFVLHTGYRPFVVGELKLESLAAELTLVEALVVACAVARYDESLHALGEQEEIRTSLQLE